MPRHRFALCLSIAFALLPLTGIVAAEQWPGFRGPTRDGHSAARDLPLEWSADKHIAWKTEIPGQGWSSPIVWDDRVFVTTATDGGQSCRVLSLDRRTGAVLWNKEVFRQTAGHKQEKNSYATPTPVTDGERVYAVFGEGGFAAVDFEGNVVWTNRDVKFYGEHGLGASPLLYGDLLIMPLDGSSSGPDTKVGWQVPWDKAVVLALDKKTGHKRWRGSRGLSRIAHVSPLVITVDGHDELVSCAGDAVQGFDPKSGDRLWTVYSEGEGVVPSPAFGAGLLFTSSGFSKTTIRAVRLGGHGDVTKTHDAWEQRKGAPHQSSLLYVDPLVYALEDGGVLTCLRASSGEVVWQKRLPGTYSASPVAADGRIYCLSEQGETTVLEPGDSVKLLASNPLNEKCQASMAVSHGQLFIRGEQHLFCIGK